MVAQGEQTPTGVDTGMASRSDIQLSLQLRREGAAATPKGLLPLQRLCLAGRQVCVATHRSGEAVGLNPLVNPVTGGRPVIGGPVIPIGILHCLP